MRDRDRCYRIGCKMKVAQVFSSSASLFHRNCLWRSGLQRKHLLRRCSKAVTASRSFDLHWVAPDNREEVARVLEIAERAANRWEVTFTDFLSPPVSADVMSALAGRTDVVALPWGGYAQAERSRIAFGQEDIMQSFQADPASSGCVAALEVKGNFMFDPARHPDFLGAILGTGVVRGKVGDILVQGESGAQILVDPEMVEHFEMTLVQVRTVPVKTSVIPLDKLNVRPLKAEEMNSVEASLRLDAIASAGFRMSRAKMADMIKGGDVRVNWRATTKGAMELKEGDVVSCAGKGRIEVRSIQTTKKDRYAVTIMRYV